MSAIVDIVVPVHSPTRPVARLAESVLEGTRAPVRLLFIAHDTPASGLAESLGRWAGDTRVEIVEHADGVRSPAGPLRRALDLVSAPYFTKIDSDDRLAPGAIDSWLHTADALGVDIVMPRMREDGARGCFPTPPRRRLRRVLDPVRDRLAYRTSTMGLISSSLRDAARPSPGLAVGEDIVPSIRLWFSGARIGAAESGARYLVGSDARDRTTAGARPIAQDLAFVDVLLADPVWVGMTHGARVAVATKMLRVHVSSAVVRAARRGWPRGDLASATAAASALAGAAPGVRRVLSRADVALLDELVSGGDPERAAMLAAARFRYLRPASLTTARVADVLRRDAPLRFLAASEIARRFG
jgi:hypothetical protein